ncbi:sulfatase-like hydrolase/transferase [Thalassotalea fonticola]|uniref:Sulfatase-like hydrolase/transferase n=1 Tax=Thalassotalea fonticola TaxID=3065649 RepID=A0ABZ0GQR2_9GAMM|nr:sulfatase-like hydrolase/transferase [Colwelliaceae bacterium S1-1]
MKKIVAPWQKFSRTCLLVLPCLFVSAVSSASTENIADTERPNILFLLTDDQTVNTINALGNKAIKTPNLDRLARNGTTFSHVFNQGSWSPAVCAPSRAMINTGRNVYRTGFGPKKSGRKSYPLWGETFRNAGYETFMSGKWHVTKEAFTRSFDLANAVYAGGMSRKEDGGQWQPKMWNYDATAAKKDNFVVYSKKQHSSEQIAEAAVDYINGKGRRNEKPFLMYVAFLAPHDPRQSPQEYVDMYPGQAVPLPASYMAQHHIDQGDFTVRDEQLLPFPREPQAVKSFIGEYYAMITHLDEQIGKVLTALEASEFAKNTIVVMTSDHGLAVGKHGMLGKQNQYDHSIRAPFIVKGEGIAAGRVAKGMFYLNSVFPTTAELAGIDIPETVDAPSIVPLIQGKTDKMFDHIVGSYRHFQRMVRNDRYKLIYYPMIKKTQLFDLVDDPDELRNLADLLEHQQTISELRVELETLKQWTGDPLLDSDPKGSYANYLGEVRCDWQVSQDDCTQPKKRKSH